MPPATDWERTVVITGMGIISAAGSTPQAVWERVVEGNSPAVVFADPQVADSPSIAAAVVSTLSSENIRVRRSHKMDRCVQLGLEAAAQAFTDSQLHTKPVEASRLGVVAGTSRGPAQKWTELIDLIRGGCRRLPPTLAAHSTLACLSGALAMAFEAGGPCWTTSATCASAAHALAQAAQQILLGTADVMLAGGAEAPLLDPLIRQLLSTGILGAHADPAQTCRPFDATRNGTLLGEGAAFLVLESLASARRRGVPIHAQLAGWAMGSDHYQCAAPRDDGEGLYQVMKQALALARLPEHHLDYINAHGTGTELNDRLEALALRRLLADRLPSVPCTSTKPVTGHCLGASPALEAVISIMALHHQCIPKTANCTTPDPECPLDVVPGCSRPGRLRAVMSNSLGFWGNNAALVFLHADALNS
jgi:3-oxoacyl-[acyl-carrier-protein] synthase II